MKAEQIHENKDQAALYFNRRENYFLVTAIAKQGYGSVEVGAPVKISGDEFEKRLGKFSRKPWIHSMAIRQTISFAGSQESIRLSGTNI